METMKFLAKNGKDYFYQDPFEKRWWKVFPTDKPNMFIGTTEYLPKYVQKMVDRAAMSMYSNFKLKK